MSQPRIVYSTEHGRMCPECAQPVADCRCRKGGAGAAASGDGVVRVQRETKGRRGKTVTTVTGVPLVANELKALAKELKKSCGSGGAVKDGAVERGLTDGSSRGELT